MFNQDRIIFKNVIALTDKCTYMLIKNISNKYIVLMKHENNLYLRMVHRTTTVNNGTFLNRKVLKNRHYVG